MVWTSTFPSPSSRRTLLKASISIKSEQKFTNLYSTHQFVWIDLPTFGTRCHLLTYLKLNLPLRTKSLSSCGMSSFSWQLHTTQYLHVHYIICASSLSLIHLVFNNLIPCTAGSCTTLQGFANSFAIDLQHAERCHSCTVFFLYYYRAHVCHLW